MDTRNTVEITINGRRYKLSGNESTAYMQQVAEYVNGKYDKLKELPGFTSRSQDYQTLMMYLNLADDYLKKSGWTEEKQVAANTKAEEEIYRLKLELVEARKQTEALEAARSEENRSLKAELKMAEEERNRLSERDKETSSKLTGLQKELEGYKTETAVLKRKLSDYVKNASQVEKQLKDAAAREREEKLLKNKYEAQLEKQKADYEAGLEDLQKQLSEALEHREEDRESLREQYRKQVESQEEQLAVLQKRVTAQRAEYENKTSEIQKQLAAAKAAYEVELDQIQKQAEEQAGDYEEQLVEMRAEYENKLSSMKPGYEDLLTEQENEYEAQLKEQKGSYEAQLEEQKGSYEAQLTEQKKEEENQLKSLTGTYEKRLAELFAENGELLREKRQLQGTIHKLEESRDTGKNQELTTQNTKLTEENQKLTTQNTELTGKNQELTAKVQDDENDMIEYLDLIEEKDREIASLKFKLQEGNYA